MSNEEKVLNAEQIFEFCQKQNKAEPLKVKEWGGTVLLNPMTGLMRDKFEAKAMDLNQGAKEGYNVTGLRAWLAAQLIVDEEGKRVFSDTDVEALNAMPNGGLERVWREVKKRNALGAEFVSEAGKN